MDPLTEPKTPTDTETPPPLRFAPYGFEPTHESQPPQWPPEPDPESSPPRRESFLRRRVAPIGAAIVALLAKLKALLLFAGQFKLLVTAGSMAVSVAAYASIWGWTFALGFVVLLLIHETGHVIALRREGLPASAPMFIPFLGLGRPEEFCLDDVAEARVGLAGPVLGSVGASACLLIWQLTGNTFWEALGFTGLFLNLFNLLPVVPLDGGRAMAAMSPWMWVVGLVAMIALVIAFPNPVIIIIAILAAVETWKRLQARRHGGIAQAAYYRVAARDRLLIGAVYIGLIVALVVGMDATHLHATL